MVEYCSADFQKALAGYGMRSSMSRKGNCWDNAPTESLWCAQFVCHGSLADRYVAQIGIGANKSTRADLSPSFHSDLMGPLRWSEACE